MTFKYLEFPWPQNLINEKMVKTIQRTFQGRHYQFVYFVELINGQRIVLKVNSQDSDELKNEMIRTEWVNGKIPVPKVLNYHKNNGIEYLLTSLVEGLVASDYRHEVGQSSLGYLLGKGLKKIHQLPIDDCNFFDFTPDQLIEMVIQNVATRKEEISNVVNEAFPESSVEQLLDYLQLNKPTDDELVFTHGDYGSGNVIINKGKISAFLDWGSSGVSDAYYDIYYLIKSLTVYSNRKDELADFLTGYEIEDFDLGKLRFHQIIDALLL